MKAQPSSKHGVAPTQAKSFLRSLLALPELGFRLKWLERHVQASTASSVAHPLDIVAQGARGTDPRASEALIALAVFLAQKRDTELIESLRRESTTQALLALGRLVRKGSSDCPPRIEPEAQIPDYGTGRELSVGERRSLARRPTRAQIERLLLDPHPLVLEPLFQCPTLTEEDVVLIATRRPARVLALDLLLHSPRWMTRRRVRISLILNPATPFGLALPLVNTCRREDLLLLVSTANLDKGLRRVAHELQGSLPPLKVPAPLVHH